MSFAIGDKVRINPRFARNEVHRTSTYTVVKINPRTLGLKNNVTGAKLNADPEVLMAANATAPEPEAIVTTVSLTTINIGTIVTVDPRRVRGVDPKALYVVTGHGGGHRYIGHRFSKLGGSDGRRYYGGVDPAVLTPVSLEDAAAKIVDAL